jgi:gamma-glutamylcyclotransferase (GGCT)/AIG2-like uncharacterized protein YtfP
MIDLTRHLFVYGTLLAAVVGRPHPMLAARADLVSRGSIPGRLYDVGDYPAAVPSADGDDRIHGELYAIRPGREDELLPDLDQYEGFHPDRPEESLFVRVEAPVERQPGGTTWAWTYVFNRSVDGLPPITSGDYASHASSAAEP